MIDAIPGDEFVVHWVALRTRGAGAFKDAQSLAILEDNKLIGGIVYTHWTGNDIQLSIATISPRWATRRTLGAIFGYVFDRCGCKRCTVLVGHCNEKSRDLVYRLGFRLEGLLRESSEGDGDLEVWGLVKSECKWITPREQKIPSAAACA